MALLLCRWLLSAVRRLSGAHQLRYVTLFVAVFAGPLVQGIKPAGTSSPEAAWGWMPIGAFLALWLEGQTGRPCDPQILTVNMQIAGK